MTDYELLSKMLSGELSREEARALKERMKREPELARAWEAMSDLPRLIARLPEVRAPRSLDQAVLDGLLMPHRVVRARRMAGWGVALVGAAAAAALALAVGGGSPPPQTLLVSGQQVVEGEVTVMAGSIPVQVSGRALISVEPPAGFARESGAEEREMKLQDAAAALLGAAVTVAVYEGSATLRAGEEGEIVLEEGQTRRISGEESPAPVATRSAPEGGAPGPATREELAARVEELEAELEKMRFEQQVAKGRLNSHEGRPQDWPSDLDSSFRPDSFERLMADTFQGREGMELLSVDCEEYPCFAVVQSFSDEEGDWARPISELVEGASSQMGYSGEVGQSVWASHMAGDEGSFKLVGIALMPEAPEGVDNEELSTRLSWRVNGALKDASGG